MENCVFCQIIKGQIPAHKIYEDKDFLAFLDIKPFNKGHSLLIPKKHYRWVIETPNFSSYWVAAGKVAKAIKKTLNPDTIVFVTWGFEVPHAHIHIIPKWFNDDFTEINWIGKRKNFSEEEMKEIAEKIRKNF